MFYEICLALSSSYITALLFILISKWYRCVRQGQISYAHVRLCARLYGSHRKTLRGIMCQADNIRIYIQTGWF